MKASYHLRYWLHNGSLDENQCVHEYALTPAHSGTQVQCGDRTLDRNDGEGERTEIGRQVVFVGASVGKHFKLF